MKLQKQWKYSENDKQEPEQSDKLDVVSIVRPAGSDEKLADVKQT